LIKRDGNLFTFESPGKVLRFDCVRGTLDLIDSTNGWVLINQATCGYNNRVLAEGNITVRPGTHRVEISSFFDDEKVRLDLSITLHARTMAYMFDISLTNLSDTPLRLDTISPFILRADRGGDLLVPRPTWYLQGYHSWEPCRIQRLPARSGEPLVSHWMTVMEDFTSSMAIVMGFTTFTRALSSVTIAADGRSLEASTFWEGIHLRPDRTLNGERFMLTMTFSGQEGLELWAHMAGGDMKARQGGTVPAGWCSWYQAFEHIDEGYISRNIDYAAFRGYIQVDDGYQVSEGDWLLPNSRFSHGIQALAMKAHERHMKLGIWVAPFMVSSHSTLFKSHPSWLIKDRHGAPLPLLEWRTGTMFGLDASHPEAQKWLTNVFSVMSSEWGVDLFKLDFLYLGAAQGVRHRRSWTGAQAYRKGIELIRDAAGDRFLLFCGAPIGPSIGIADAMRVSGDTGTAWKGELSASTSVMGTLQRFYMHRRLWINDPDCLILRDSDTELTLAEVETIATVAGLSGGVISSGDDQMSLSDDRRALLYRLLPPFGKCAQPSSLFAPGGPLTFDLRIERTFAAWHVIAFFNFSDSVKDLTCKLSSLGMRKKEYLVYEFWTDTFLGISSDSIMLNDVPPHGTRLLCVRALVGHPQLLSTDLHISQGGMEIGSLVWVRRQRALRMTIRTLPPHEGRLLFYVPPGFALRDVACTAGRFSSRVREDHLLEVTCSTGNPFQLTLLFDENLEGQ